jgi:hypothetical protein
MSIFPTKAKDQHAMTSSGTNTSYASSSKPTALNPLDIFPSKSDTLAKTFFSIDNNADSRKTKKKKKPTEMEKWLSMDSINPEFGISVIFFIHYFKNIA